MRTTRLLITLSLLFAQPFYPQKRVLDSLKNQLENNTQDTVRVNTLGELVTKLRQQGDYQAATSYAEEGMALARKLSFKKGEAYFNTELGIIYWYQDNYAKALKFHERALALFRDIGIKKGIASSHTNLGNIHCQKGNYPEALTHYLSSLKTKEEIGDKRGEAICHSNIGIVYWYQGDVKKALERYMISLKLMQELGNKSGMAAAYNNIALVHASGGNYQEAHDYYSRTLILKEELGDEQGVADLYINLGNLLADEQKPKEALVFYEKALKKEEALGDLQGKATCLSNMGMQFLDLKDLKRARQYISKALSISLETGAKEMIHEGHAILSRVDSAQGNFRSALDNYKLSVVYGDSLQNEESTKKTVRLEMNYEFDKKEAAAKLEQEKKEAIAGAEKKKQRIILLAISGFGLLVLCFALFAWRSFLQKKKANEAITKQKHVIEEKQKEILDSIYYARRIQRSLLTSEKFIHRKISDLKKA